MRDYSLNFLVVSLNVPEHRARRIRRGVDTLTPEEKRRAANIEAAWKPILPKRQYIDRKHKRPETEGRSLPESHIKQPVKKICTCKTCGKQFKYAGRRWKYCSGLCAAKAEGRRTGATANGSLAVLTGANK